MTAETCAFCAIAMRGSGELVYEDQAVVGFLPLALYARGHTLLVPRRHSTSLAEARTDDLASLLLAARRFEGQLAERLGATGVNLLLASGPGTQQSVPHLHLHVIPRFPDDGLDAWPALTAVELDRETLVRQMRGLGAVDEAE